MKAIRFKNILLAATLGLSFNACDDFIDVAPEGKIDEDTAFSHQEEMGLTS